MPKARSSTTLPGLTCTRLSICATDSSVPTLQIAQPPHSRASSIDRPTTRNRSPDGQGERHLRVAALAMMGQCVRWREQTLGEVLWLLSKADVPAVSESSSRPCARGATRSAGDADRPPSTTTRSLANPTRSMLVTSSRGRCIPSSAKTQAITSLSTRHAIRVQATATNDPHSARRQGNGDNATDPTGEGRRYHQT